MYKSFEYQVFQCLIDVNCQEQKKHELCKYKFGSAKIKNKINFYILFSKSIKLLQIMKTILIFTCGVHA